MEVSALKDKYKILAAGLSGDHSADYKFINLAFEEEPSIPEIKFHFGYPVIFKKIISAFIRIIYSRHFYKIKHAATIKEQKEYRALKDLHFDLIIVHHIWHLQLAKKLAEEKKVKIIFNAHEYYPLEFDKDPEWMRLHHENYNRICRETLPSVNICFCVGAIIAAKYEQEFNLKSVVVANTKPYYDLQPKEVAGKIKIVHHGLAIRSRKLELMFDMMNFLSEEYHLTLVLVPSGDKAYFDLLKEKAKGNPKVSLIEPVQVELIPVMLNAFDIGVFILPFTNYNYTNALPNKFFEFVQGRLMVAVGPSPEMSALVKQYNLGIVADDFEPQTIAKEIASLSREQIKYFKNQSHRNARILSDETTRSIILAETDKLVA